MISTSKHTHLTKKKKEKNTLQKGLSSVVSPPFLCTLNIRAGVMLPKVRMRCLNVLTGSVVLSWQVILWPAGVFTDSHHQFLVIPNCTARALSSTCLLHTLWALTMPPPLAASFPSPSLLPDPPPSDHLLFSSSLRCSPLFRLSSHMWQIPIKYLERGEKLLAVHVVEGFSALLYGITSTPARLRLRVCEWKKRDAPPRQQDCEVLHIQKSF